MVMRKASYQLVYGRKLENSSYEKKIDLYQKFAKIFIEKSCRYNLFLK